MNGLQASGGAQRAVGRFTCPPTGPPTALLFVFRMSDPLHLTGLIMGFAPGAGAPPLPLAALVSIGTVVERRPGPYRTSLSRAPCALLPGRFVPLRGGVLPMMHFFGLFRLVIWI